jgi:inhibitor of cysteine peptidase
MKSLWFMAACLAIGSVTIALGQAPMSGPSVTLHEADNGKAVTLHVGEAIAVTLPENASTGYVWAVDSIDPALVALRGSQASYPTGAIGAGGQVTWTFVATAPGMTMVALKRWRQWEGDASVVQRFEFRLTIAR